MGRRVLTGTAGKIAPLFTDFIARAWAGQRIVKSEFAYSMRSSARQFSRSHGRPVCCVERRKFEQNFMPSRQLKSGRRLDDASFLAVVIVSMSERERESNNPVVRARRTNGTARVMIVWNGAVASGNS